MERYNWRMVIAFSMLLSLVIPFNFYVFYRLTGLLVVYDFWISLIYAVLLTGLLLVGFFLFTSHNRTVKMFFVGITTIYGLDFSALLFLFSFEMVNLLYPLPALQSGLVILFLIAAIAIISTVNSQVLAVKKVKIKFYSKLKAVLLSDLHIGIIHGKRYLSRVVDKVNDLEPDMVFITGDIVSGAPLDEKGLFDHLGRIKARTFMVTGNHEFYESVEAIQKLLEPTHVEILRDVKVDMGGYSVFGLDYSHEQGITGARKIEISGSQPVILLTHVPQLPQLPKGSIVLAGHYHAGQVFPVNFLGRFMVNYFTGLYEKDGVRLYVSPETATWGPPMRFGSRNEITLLELG